MWLISKICPIFGLPKSEIPTEPRINMGPELLVKAIKRSASAFEQILLSYKLQTTLAPTGYPLIIPIIIAIALSPGTLKTGFINLFKNLPKICIKLVRQSNSVAIKNGKSVGRTEFAHSFKPFCAASKLLAENKIRLKVNNIKSTVKKYFFIEITIKRMDNLDAPFINLE